jgi:hypothetical protein
VRQCGLGIPNLPPAKAENLASYTATRPRSADRTPVSGPVSRKREYFKYLPETIGDFAPTAAGFGARRLLADSQKPAIGGHFSAY